MRCYKTTRARTSRMPRPALPSTARRAIDCCAITAALLLAASFAVADGIDCETLLAKSRSSMTAQFRGEGKALNILPDGRRESIDYEVARVRISEKPVRYATTLIFTPRDEGRGRLRFVVRANDDGSSPSLLMLEGELPTTSTRVLGMAFTLDDFVNDPTRFKDECAGEVKEIAGRKCALVFSKLPEHEGKQRIERWLDIETGTLVMIVWRGADGKEEREVAFSGFRETKDGLFPSRVTATGHRSGVRTVLSIKGGAMLRDRKE